METPPPLLNKETNNSSLHAECLLRAVLENPGRDAKTIELDEGKSKQIALPSMWSVSVLCIFQRGFDLNACIGNT
jgi:hypothetical protein